MLIGGLVGGAISLFNRHNRREFVDHMVQWKDNTVNMYKQVSSNPRQVSDQLRDTASNIRLTAQEVSNDIKEMVDDLDGVRRSSTQAYRYAMEAGGEIGQIAQKIKTTGSSVKMVPQASTPTSIPVPVVTKATDINNQEY